MAERNKLQTTARLDFCNRTRGGYGTGAIYRYLLQTVAHNQALHQVDKKPPLADERAGDDDSPARRRSIV